MGLHPSGAKRMRPSVSGLHFHFPKGEDWLIELGHVREAGGGGLGGVGGGLGGGERREPVKIHAMATVAKRLHV